MKLSKTQKIILLAAAAICLAVPLTLTIAMWPEGDPGSKPRARDYYGVQADFNDYCSETPYLRSPHNRESPFICDLHQRLQALEAEQKPGQTPDTPRGDP